MDTDSGSEAGPHTGHRTYISIDSDSEDGGMQLDVADQEMPLAEMEDGMHIDASEDSNSGDEDDDVTDEDEEEDDEFEEEERNENDFTTRPVNPHSSVPNAHNTPSQPGHRGYFGHFPAQQNRPQPQPRRLRTKGHLTEEQHAALAVLSNWELLVTHALNNHRTIPQTRRRFQAKLLAAENPTLENELYASRFVIPASKSEFLPPMTSASNAGGPGTGGSRPYETASGVDNSTAFLISGSYREVIEDGDLSWWPQGKPREKRKSNRGLGLNRAGNESSLSVGSEGSSRVVSRAGSVGRG
ncbi:Uncharacterized protein PECH_003322 [Penicillium ucsense]|uniref:Uncharacterized protein n=1 Tax=Penicillium ucsense TaxID=2839758 RepID=A0A8J8VXR0_9EURO|nr:Uncharacterized protein PECM_000956 [Penicillium ucsense]KAF7729501.1 Uncharacterized protein PECH_003322 [Penicillium ucsense]